jgi:tol-pal system protein YbgF
MARRFPVLILSLLIVATVISMPATGANREHQQMMGDIRILQEHALDLQAQIADVTAALKALSAKLDEQSGTTRRAFADQKVLADNVAGDLRVIREKVDDNNVRVGSLAQEMEAIRQAIAQIPAQPLAAGEPAPGAQPQQPPGQGTPPPTALGMSPQKLFDTAWGDYTVGQFSLAITGFTNYIKAFPTLDKAGEAQWYVGESYFGMGNYKDAIASYDRVIADYPNNRLVPDAYYKRGVAYNALGQPDKARESWEFVIKTYPSSEAGRLARQRLDQLIRKEPGLF